MRCNHLGRTGLRVSELRLGTMTLGGADRFRVIGDVRRADAERRTFDAVSALAMEYAGWMMDFRVTSNRFAAARS